MGKNKKNTNTTITIECDSQEVYAALLNFFGAAKEQFAAELKSMLTRAGIENDASFSVNPVTGVVKATYRSGDKGTVLTAVSSDSLNVTKYKSIEKESIYALPEGGQYSVYQKRKGVDKLIGHFRSWTDVISGLATVKAPVETPVEAPQADAVIGK